MVFPRLQIQNLEHHRYPICFNTILVLSIFSLYPSVQRNQRQWSSVQRKQGLRPSAVLSSPVLTPSSIGQLGVQYATHSLWWNTFELTHSSWIAFCAQTSSLAFETCSPIPAAPLLNAGQSHWGRWQHGVRGTDKEIISGSTRARHILASVTKVAFGTLAITFPVAVTTIGTRWVTESCDKKKERSSKKSRNQEIEFCGVPLFSLQCFPFPTIPFGQWPHK